MGKNLFDFADSKIDMQINEDEAIKTLKENNINTEDMKETYNKYKNYSRDDLANEFINVIKRQKNNGSLDNSKINDVIEKLSPYINEQQKEFLTGLIAKTDE